MNKEEKRLRQAQALERRRSWLHVLVVLLAAAATCGWAALFYTGL